MPGLYRKTWRRLMRAAIFRGFLGSWFGSIFSLLVERWLGTWMSSRGRGVRGAEGPPKSGEEWIQDTQHQQNDGCDQKPLVSLHVDVGCALCGECVARPG